MRKAVERKHDAGGRNLPGTCGMPRECDWVYVGTEYPPRGLDDDVDVPKRLIWPDGRSRPIKSAARHVAHGRAALGNNDMASGRWFVGKPKGGTARSKRR